MSFSPRVSRDLLVAGVTSVLAVLLNPAAFLGGESFFERDLHLDWYPRIEALARCVREGAWPLWDTSIGFGQPLLADPGAQVAYPVTWLAVAVPGPAAYTVFVLLHLLVAALGASRLAARLGAGPLGGPVAAALFVLSGPVQSSLNLWHHFAGLAWMPWVLLGVDRAIRAPRLSSALGLTLVASLQVLAGSADVCAMTLALAVGWTVVSLLGRPRFRRQARVTLGTLAASTLLTACLTAVVWWPATELLVRSSRQELPEDIRTAWSLPPAGVWRLVAPLDPGRVPFAAETWRQLYNRPQAPFLWSLYLGLPALGLAAAALVAPGRRLRVAALGLAALVALALALGPHAPFYPLATSLAPVLKVFRYPTKALLAMSFLVALLSGLGLNALSRGRLGSRAGLGLGLGLVVAGGLSALAGARFGAIGGWPLGLAAAAAGLVWVLCSRGRASPRVAALALAGVALADLVAAHAGLNATAPAALIFHPPPAVARGRPRGVEAPLRLRLPLGRGHRRAAARQIGSLRGRASAGGPGRGGVPGRRDPPVPPPALRRSLRARRELRPGPPRTLSAGSERSHLLPSACGGDFGPHEAPAPGRRGYGAVAPRARLRGPGAGRHDCQLLPRSHSRLAGSRGASPIVGRGRVTGCRRASGVRDPVWNRLRPWPGGPARRR